MKLTFEIDGIQEGKQYTLDFCVSEDGQVKKTTKTKSSPLSTEKKKGPSLEDFEEHKEKPKAPSLDDPVIIKKKMSDFKVESSFGDNKIDGSI